MVPHGMQRHSTAMKGAGVGKGAAMKGAACFLHRHCLVRLQLPRLVFSALYLRWLLYW